MNAAFPFATSFGRRAAEFFSSRAQQQRQAPPPSPQRTTKHPPASKRAIRQLPTIIVAPEDLVDPNNRECCICLEENYLNARVLRLPCAHIFHSHCILDWLNKSNTCPVCRYELVTDNAEYETIRTTKMQHRKPRFAKYELQRMTIRELRQLGERLNVNLTGCMEKQQMIDVLLASDQIQVISAPQPVEYPLSLLHGMKVSELKQCMASAGVFFDPKYVVEKQDMVQLFIASGRLVVVEEEETTNVQEAMSVETTSRPEVHDGSSQVSWNPSDTRRVSSSTPVVTTVHEDSSDEDGNDDEDSCRDSQQQLPQSNPLMEEIPFQDGDDNAPESNNGDMSSDDDDSVIMEKDQEKDNDKVDDEANEANDVDMTEPMDSLLDLEDDSSNLSMEEDSETTRMQHETENVETTYPRLVGRHASTGSQDVPLVDDYASAAATASQDSRFVERSISDLYALAREMRVDITDCIERSEITARLVSATGRTDLQLEPNDFLSWSVSELRALARAVNVDLSCCADRLTMIAKLIEVANERPRLADYLSALMPLAHLTIPQLRAVGREWQVNLSDCIEKEEMIHRLIIAGPSSSQHD